MTSPNLPSTVVYIIVTAKTILRPVVSAGVNLAPRGHLPRDIVAAATEEGCHWHLVGRSQLCRSGQCSTMKSHPVQKGQECLS